MKDKILFDKMVELYGRLVEKSDCNDNELNIMISLSMDEDIVKEHRKKELEREYHSLYKSDFSVQKVNE